MPHVPFDSSHSTHIPPEELAAFVGPNAQKYLRKWGTERPESRVNWHWVAFFFAPFWFAYRKMYPWLFGLIAIGFINFFFMPKLAANFINLTIAVLSALFAYPIYYRHARAKIARVKDSNADPSTLTEEIRRAGGTSPLALTLVIIGYVVVWVVIVVFYVLVAVQTVTSTQTSTSRSSSFDRAATSTPSSSVESNLSAIDPATLSIGTSFDEKSPNLDVSGTDYRVGKDLYLRVAAPASDNAFAATKLTFRLEKQMDKTWQEIDTVDVDVKPDWNVYVEPFSVSASGTYLVRVLKGPEVYGEIQFTVKP
jgi:hypothetical protein